MDSVGAGSGGGMHPGAPIIWPTIKPTTQIVTESESVTESQSQSTSSSTSSPTTSRPTSTSSPQTSSTLSSSSTTSAATISSSSATVARTLSSQDISAQLMSVGLADTTENQQLASKMLEYGLELSEENFQQLFKALQNKGSNASVLASAFTALAKGVATNQAAVRSLTQFFANENNLAAQFENLQASISHANQTLSGQAVLNPSLANRLAALLSEFDLSLRKAQNKDFSSKPAVASKSEQIVLGSALTRGVSMNQPQQAALKSLMSPNSELSKEELELLQKMVDENSSGFLNEEESGVLKSLLGRGNLAQFDGSRALLGDMNALKALLAGLLQSMKAKPNSKQDELMGVLEELQTQLGDTMDNLTGQAVLSKLSKYYDPGMPDKYHYWMIPNPFSELPKNIEILIKRDATKKNAPINPLKTQIIMKVETETLGDVAVIVDISGQDIWYVFNAANDDARRLITANSAILRERMSSLDFNVKGFNAQVK
ncbi:MAG: hypothetical protein AABZ14_05230, partial [Candidatus Margulisiibacteriota bacterium]